MEITDGTLVRMWGLESSWGYTGRALARLREFDDYALEALVMEMNQLARKWKQQASEHKQDCEHAGPAYFNEPP